MSAVRRHAPFVVLVLAAVLPWSTVDIPGLFDGPLNSPGSLQLLATCLVFGGLALGYDLLFGRAGLLSSGHALYFADGAYTTTSSSPTPTGHCGRPRSSRCSVPRPRDPARIRGPAHRRDRLRHGDARLSQVGVVLVDRDPGGA